MSPRIPPLQVHPMHAVSGIVELEAAYLNPELQCLDMSMELLYHLIGINWFKSPCIGQISKILSTDLLNNIYQLTIGTPMMSKIGPDPVVNRMSSKKPSVHATTSAVETAGKLFFLESSICLTASFFWMIQLEVSSVMDQYF